MNSSRVTLLLSLFSNVTLASDALLTESIVDFDAPAWSSSGFEQEQGQPTAKGDWRRLVHDQLRSESGGSGGQILLAQADDTAAVGPPPAETAAPGGMSEDEMIAEAMLNPLSHLWLLFAQSDFISYDGDVLNALGKDAQLQNTTLLMPVLSQQLTEDWKMIFRPVVPINSFKTVDNVNLSTDTPGNVTGVDLNRETGLGDIVLWSAFSNTYTPPNIVGVGTTVMLDTATDDYLGSGKNSAGPMALAFNISDKWVNGFIAQHWWSFSGSDHLDVDTDAGKVRVERPDVNLTDLQVVVRYRYSAMTNIGAAPNWRYNWETDQLSLPVGIGFDTLVKIGGIPTKIGAEVYYYVEQDDDFGPEWQLRLLFVPVMPSPDWSKVPLFGR